MWKLTLFSVFMINTFEIHLVTSSISHVAWHPQPPLSAISPHPRQSKAGHSPPILIPAVLQLPSTIQDSSHLSHAVLVPLPPKQYPQIHQHLASPARYPSHPSPVNHYAPPPSPHKGNLPLHYASPLPPANRYPLPHSRAVNNYKYPHSNVQVPPLRRYLPPAASHIPRYPQPPPSNIHHLPPPASHKESLTKNMFIPAKNVFKGACPMVRLPVCAASCTLPLRVFYNICFMRLYNLRNRADYRVIQYGPCKFLNYDGKKAMKAYPYAGGYPPHK